MVVEPVATSDDLQKLIPEWNGLLDRCPWSSPFQMPEWLLPWWDTFGSGELFSFAVRECGRLVGLAPMFLHPWQGKRQVTFLGNGVSDRLDFVLDPEFAEEAAGLILERIKTESTRWDLCDLQDLPEASPIFRLSAAKPQYTCMSFSLPGDVQCFRNSLPHGLRRNVRRYAEHLSALGEITFETAGEDHFDDSFQTLIYLHRARWAARDDAGMIDGEAMERFHTRAAENLQARGIARLHVLKLNGIVSAAAYLLLHRSRAYSYLGGFDPALTRFSPGALILNYAIEQCIREGVREFDFLRGDERYKRDWGAVEKVSYRLLLSHDEK